MKTKLTPGPWTVHKGMPDCVTFEGRHGTENLFLSNLDGYYACQSEADARLIAAAPELLQALQDMLMCATETMGCGKQHAIDGARTAIAKANGEPA